MKAGAASLQALRAPLRRTAVQPSSAYRYRQLSASARVWQEQKAGPEGEAGKEGSAGKDNAGKKEEKKEEKKRGWDDDAAPPQSPFKVFLRVFREEIDKNQGWQQNVKQLQGDVDKFADSQAMKAAREVYERTRITNMMKENPRLAAAVEDLKKAGVSVNDAVSKALQDSEVLKAIARVSNSMYVFADRATQPVRDTEAYKAIAASVEEAFDDTAGSNLRYGGYIEKEERRRRREARAAKAGKTSKRTAENPEAGEALVLSAKQDTSSTRFQFIKENPTYQRLRESYYESENPAVETFRSMASTVAGWFDENETAKVIRTIRESDPDFTMDGFTRELREYIVPEVVEAYLMADREALKAWCSEATYNVLWATMGQYIKQGLVSDSRVLDIKHVDISQGKLLENDVPVFVVTFASQEILLFRSAKTGEPIVGSENAVEACRYAMVLTRVPTDVDNEITGGWKVVEMARRGQRSFL